MTTSHDLPEWAKWSFSLALVLFVAAGVTLSVNYTTSAILFGLAAVVVYFATMAALARSGGQQ